MPSTKKTTWAQLKVGLLAMFALGLMAVLIVLMSGNNPLFRSSVDVYTYFSDSFGMLPGATPVRLNGILIGEVSDIELSGEPDPTRMVRVTLAIDEDSLGLITTDSEARLTQANLLGSRYVNIRRGLAPQTIPEGGEVLSSSTTELEDLFEQGNTTLAALESIFTRLDGIITNIETGEGTIGKFLTDPTLYNSMVDTVDEVERLMLAVNNDESTLGKLINDDALYEDLRGTVSRTNTMLDSLNAGEGTAGRLLHDEALYEDIRMTIADVRQTFALINEGDGTVGKLLNSDELHNQLQGTIARLDETLDHLNSGEGTLGQLLLNPQLYETLDATMEEVHGLMQDFRADPKKFLRIKLALF